MSVCFDRVCRTSIVTRCLHFEQWEEDVGFCFSNKGWLAEIIQMIGEQVGFFFFFFLGAYLSQSCSGLLCWDCLYLHMQRILLFWAHRWQDRAINHPQILPPCNRRPLQNTPPRRVCRCASFRIFFFFLNSRGGSFLNLICQNNINIQQISVIQKCLVVSIFIRRLLDDNDSWWIMSRTSPSVTFTRKCTVILDGQQILHYAKIRLKINLVMISLLHPVV